MNFKELGANLGLEEDEFKELVELFAESGSSDFQTLQEGMAAGDAEKVMRSAHTIKGASSNLGLDDVSEVARIIEESAMNNQLNDLASPVQTLRKHFETIQSFIK
jgi:HPt (histidine-containing phosphotransfer) domain-containing protein